MFPIACGEALFYLVNIMSYYEKLKDPRWQKKRLEILNMYEFMCMVCQETEEELHVHHVYYEKGKDPWDYPDSALWCLCKSCHEEMQKQTTDLLKSISTMPGEFVPWGDFDSFLSIYSPRLDITKALINLINTISNSPLFNLRNKKVFKNYMKEFCKQVL
jgi:hypothetical protein